MHVNEGRLFIYCICFATSDWCWPHIYYIFLTIFKPKTVTILRYFFLFPVVFAIENLIKNPQHIPTRFVDYLTVEFGLFLNSSPHLRRCWSAKEIVISPGPRWHIENESWYLPQIGNICSLSVVSISTSHFTPLSVTYFFLFIDFLIWLPTCSLFA